jgi:HK97 family phage major capsid protein
MTTRNWLPVTEAVQKHLVSLGFAKEGEFWSTEEAYKAVSTGVLTPEKYAELYGPNGLNHLKQAGIATGQNMTTANNTTDDRVKNLVKEAVSELITEKGNALNVQSKSADPREVFSGMNIRVKGGDELYRTTKSVAKHRKYDFTPTDERGQETQTTSELEHALMGTLVKFLGRRAGLGPMNDHENQLMGEMLSERMKWCGKVGKEWKTGISGLEVKALLGDSGASGGIEITPEFFDSRLITFPLVGGELMPLVDLVEVPRGSAVEGASVGTPDVTWGIPSGTAASLFDTDDLINEINTSIFPVTCVILIGKDFMSDAAADIGRTIETLLVERMGNELDKVIASGNGTDRPQGLTTASGLNSVTFGGDAATVADYEALLFGISKAYRRSRRCAFISNDVSYARARGIAVSGSDQRRVFGMDHEAYTLLQRPYRIQDDLPNTTIMFGDLSRYRLYRRLGFDMQIVTNDLYLARSNQVALVLRGRYGGRVMDPNAFAKATDALA